MTLIISCSPWKGREDGFPEGALLASVKGRFSTGSFIIRTHPGGGGIELLPTGIEGCQLLVLKSVG